MDVVIKYVEGSRDDLESAAVLLAGGKPFHIPFLCHQALFKLLRGLYLETKNSYPPFETHLPTLLRKTGRQNLIDSDGLEFLHELSFYPEVVGHSVYRQKIIERGNRAGEYLDRARRMADSLIESIERS